MKHNPGKLKEARGRGNQSDWLNWLNKPLEVKPEHKLHNAIIEEARQKKLAKRKAKREAKKS